MLEDLDQDMVQSAVAVGCFLPSLQFLEPIHGFANLALHFPDLSAILRKWDWQCHKVRSEASGITMGSNETPVDVQYLSSRCIQKTMRAYTTVPMAHRRIGDSRRGELFRDCDLTCVQTFIDGRKWWRAIKMSSFRRWFRTGCRVFKLAASSFACAQVCRRARLRAVLVVRWVRRCPWGQVTFARRHLCQSSRVLAKWMATAGE